MFLAAIEATIVSTAMPAIAADLEDFSLYSWVFSAYLLMNAVTVLIYGKLSDLFGRKPIIVFGIIIFMLGSILCGFATSMEMLIAFRFLQGAGAGAVMPIASTIVGDIYTKEERAKIQGYLSSVWGISAITGPALGGLIVEYLSWHYVFWINIPLGILAIMGIVLFLHEDITKKKHIIDYQGAVLLLISISTLMFVLVEGGVHYEWTSWQIITLSIVCLTATVLFFFQEKRAYEPMLPLDIWNNRSIVIANITALTTGAMLIGISSFLPAFVQGVMERTPIVAGFTLTTMSIGWPIAATFAGQMLLKIGYRKTAVLGGLGLLIGSSIFVTLTAEAGPVIAAVGSFFIGVGMGLTTTAFIVSIQTAVSWQRRGVATASFMFMRTIGSTIGAALLGGILNSRLYQHIASSNEVNSANLNLDATTVLLDAQRRSALPIELKQLLQEGLSIALHNVYVVVGIFALVSMVVIFLLPKSEESDNQSNQLKQTRTS
ncbi:MFS transporter [Bacillus sp. HMF5848]|nr:MFS transporter [Bacillus sp. HMF5848]